MPVKININTDIIQKMGNMYIEERLPNKDIAQFYHYSPSLIRKTLIDNGVHIRPLSVALHNIKRLPIRSEIRESKYLHHSNVMKDKWKDPIYLKKMRDTRNYWSEEDTESLKILYFDRCLSLLDISKQLSRTPFAIKSRLQNLGIQMTKSESTKKYHKREHPWSNPDYRKKCSERISIVALKRWQDVDFVHKMALIWKFKPSGSENLLNVFLQNKYPTIWQYTGDGTYVIDSKIPDFINSNMKKVIELNGCYWHACENCGYGNVILPNGESAIDIHNKDNEKLNIYKRNGWDCLVVWEHDLNDMDKLSILLQDYTLNIF